MMGEKVLVIGGGGREHAICWKLSQSPQVEEIYVSPGNCGIEKIKKVNLININIKNNKEVTEWCKKNSITLVAVGPEEYLANGIANELKTAGIMCFGPEKSSALIESDKDWAKSFMDRHKIPTAQWRSFTSATEAKAFVKSAPFRALVIKATGLAAGKGVVVAADEDEACKAIDEMLVEKKFGSAGDTIVVEELLEGEEVSMLAFTDGKTVKMMPPTQDHKRIFDGDLGPNTGGMGAYGPCYLMDSNDNEIVRTRVLNAAIQGFQQDKLPYVGVLYAGLMLTKNGPKVLEFNCRFGDPETQIIMPLLDSDLFLIMKACCQGRLSDIHINWHLNKFAVGVILASRGYPASSSKGQVITGINTVESRPDHYVFHSGTASSNGEIVTNGGRVLITTCLSSSLESAAAKATIAARDIKFDGKQYRHDIAHKGIASSILKSGTLSYKSSGVDIEAGDSLVGKIKALVSGTKRSGVMGSIGGFGGLFDTHAAGFVDPILVSGTDGVGTKLKIAIESGKHGSVGIDLVAMCVNDVLAHGAEPLFFLDYFACGNLDVNIAAEVVSGIVEGCKRAGCSLIGGETAEMPDMYADGDYDLAGFAVGAVERTDLLPRTNDIIVGDVVIGLPSSGVHSNGFSLVRKIIKLSGINLHDTAPFSERTIADELLVPTKIYTRSVVTALKSKIIKAFAHITGGGLIENVPRILPNDLGVILNAEQWKIPKIFGWLATAGGVNELEMLRTFNCGIGAVIICSKDIQDQVLKMLEQEEPVVIGSVVKKTEKSTVVNNFSRAIGIEMRQHVPKLMERLMSPRKKVGVLISGSGTNLQALIDATRDPAQQMAAEIVLVISNKADVEGLRRAERAGIPTRVIKHTDYKTRQEFDEAMDAELIAAEVQIVCLAGFMRILTEKFVRKWKGALLNIHPSLLPAFKGANAHKDVLEMGARITGCTVHFVEVEIDSGAIIEQEAVPVLPNDTIESLQERVKIAEHKIFPKALQYLATGRIKLNDNNKIQWNY
ncbi:trifunctional purine biosynthetic protein adenosine-3-like [Microplitis mediator]|uniref:trifunctional purine biosynthetic protein adenosine-3-like n=1 Tax=Microplitis mediator TaxID=375433 RepID=UPI0025528696|nr:trifunctional purine biosynthetic protein adenosine-3-like [Microplitis mediator]